MSDRHQPRGGRDAARTRAARAYADLPAGDLAARLGWSTATLARVERGARTLTTDERTAIATACGLPASFFTIDLERLDAPTIVLGDDPRGLGPVLRDVLERLDRLERTDEAAA